jgi:hypothetical protein
MYSASFMPRTFPTSGLMSSGIFAPPAFGPLLK